MAGRRRSPRRGAPARWRRGHGGLARGCDSLAGRTSCSVKAQSPLWRHGRWARLWVQSVKQRSGRVTGPSCLLNGPLSRDYVVWPDSCGELDVLRDGLFDRAAYMKGAWFYRDVAGEIGAESLDLALAAVFAASSGEAAPYAGCTRRHPRGQRVRPVVAR